VPKLLGKIDELYELKAMQALVTARGNRVEAAFNLGISVQHLSVLLHRRNNRLLGRAKAEGWIAPARENTPQHSKRM
jgi:hypothetical protein